MTGLIDILPMGRRQISLAATVLTVVTITSGSAARDRFQRLDLNRDGVITLPDLLSVSDRRIRRIDTNGDGAVSRQELAAFLAGRAVRRANRSFRQADRNGDGRVTAAEAAGQPRLMQADANGDGAVTLAELTAFLQRRARRWQARIFRRFDTDGNGLISRSERKAATLARFRQLDANRDGAVTRQEFDLARQRWLRRRDQ